MKIALVTSQNIALLRTKGILCQLFLKIQVWGHINLLPFKQVLQEPEVLFCKKIAVTPIKISQRVSGDSESRYWQQENKEN